ncbi:hypothetical protein DM02DRAFT_288756 [Periconia macrospinosa]|uniref:Uncharacterized protein n=1 Tax=Periconia macrospinosa TaxID=97972 RepID=A0A2V1ECG2_9PLEO|nr:hypothetical protein DM02DRAFT_288756 [Periconia macrospinosa]
MHFLLKQQYTASTAHAYGWFQRPGFRALYQHAAYIPGTCQAPFRRKSRQPPRLQVHRAGSILSRVTTYFEKQQVRRVQISWFHFETLSYRLMLTYHQPKRAS